MILRSATARVALLTLALWSLSAPLASAQGVDDCSQAVPDVLEAGTPLLWTGDNSTATAIGDALPGTAAAGTANFWHVFTTDSCTNITIDYCGSPTVFGSNDIWNALFTTCPADNQYLPADFVNGSACGDGNATAQFNNVPAGTYYFPVYMPPGGGGPYAINVTATACQTIVPPPNDSCSTVVPEALASGATLVFSGDNTNATHEGDWIPGFGFSTAQCVWHAITTDGCNDLVVSYCGLNPSWNNALGFLPRTCPGDTNRVLCDDCNYTECGDGNPTFHFSNVAAGTYYIPVMLDAGNDAIGPYSISVSAVACVGVPPPNDDCANVIPEVLAVNDTLTFIGDNTYATYETDFLDSTTFYGAYVVWHAITTTTCSDVTVGYCGQSPVWTNALGFLSPNCPGDSVLIFFSTFNVSDCGDGNLTYIYNDVPAGTYYIPVQLDAVNDAIGPYTLTVSAAACSGGVPPNDDCADVVPEALATNATLIFTGDNTGATLDGDWLPGFGFSNSPVVWHAFTTDACNDLIVTYCGMTPAWGNAFGFLPLTCPGDTVRVLCDDFNYVDCGDGNPTFYYNELPAGTYYLPVLLDPGSNAVGPYSIAVTSNPCAGYVPPNDLCADVDIESLNVGDTLILSGDNTNATFTDDWIPGMGISFAPVVWHAFVTDTCAEVSLSYCGLSPTWDNTFAFLATSCPGDTVRVNISTSNDTACGDGNVTYNYYQLEAGTYYVPVLYDPINNAAGPYNLELIATSCLSTGLASAERPSFTIFPNPSNGDLTVLGLDPGTEWLEVVDVTGRMLHRERSTNTAARTHELHLPWLRPGSYTLRAVGSGATVGQRFMVR
ncbi:MAG: T9SS type A sorting domain-containing protein [Flavobacteriales bacterium]|nr:T9SS type A sorting domain-containing protein [Flavobacteriales bacterium]